MHLNLRSFGHDVKLFVGAWIRWWYKRLYSLFSKFERIKGFVASALYRQRGRFARPFVHAAMAGVMALAVTLAPVLASTFPGIQEGEEEEMVLESSVMEQVEQSLTTIVPQDRVRDKVIEYQVQGGDTVSGIADKFGVSVDTIRWENNLPSINAIKPGQTLRILPVTGVKHKVARGETVYSIAKKYSANAQAMVDFPFNTFADNETFALAVGQEIIVPDGEKPNQVLWSPSTAIARRTPDAGAVSATGQFAWPIGGVITQRFAWYHRAIDVAAPHGTPILAADSGRVIVAGYPDRGGYGNRVMLDHGNGYVTMYAHLSRVDVTVGQSVRRGDIVGLEGSTGRSTGPHLHFEVRKNGVFMNPLEYLR